MLGKQSDQRGLWEADSLYIDHVGRGSFYGLSASLRGQLFRDEEFGELYCDDNGRESVPPSLLGDGASAADLRPCERRRSQAASHFEVTYLNT